MTEHNGVGIHDSPIGKMLLTQSGEIFGRCRQSFVPNYLVECGLFDVAGSAK
jgi:hypothetical protein